MEHALSVEARGICSLSRWVAVEFKKHQLRVGSPFVGTDAKSNIGAIFRLDLGDPNIYYQDHKNIASDLKAAGVDENFKVVLPIHVDSRVGSWTSAAEDTQCYKSGNACPEAHSVCDPSYCSIERWNEIIAELKKAPKLKVLRLICAFPRPHVSLQVVGLLAPPQHFDCRPSCSDLQKSKAFFVFANAPACPQQCAVALQFISRTEDYPEMPFCPESTPPPSPGRTLPGRHSPAADPPQRASHRGASLETPLQESLSRDLSPGDLPQGMGFDKATINKILCRC